MNKKTLAAAILATFTGAALAAAPAFEDVDTNTDGMISVEEAKVVEGLDFAAADTDKNDSLNKEEYEEAASKD